MHFSDLISSIGAGLILLAFALSTFRVISSGSKGFFAMNFVGGGFAFWGCLLIGSLPFAILEGTWTLVALVGLATPKKVQP
jgi:hypothetical protein